MRPSSDLRFFDFDMLSTALERLHLEVQNRFRPLWDRWPARSVRAIPFNMGDYRIMICIADSLPRVPSFDGATDLPEEIREATFPIDWDHFHELETLFRSSFDMKPDDFFIALPRPDETTYSGWKEYMSGLSAKNRALWVNVIETTLMRQLARATGGRHDVIANTSIQEPIQSKFYRRQSNFLPPVSLDQPIWRYTSLAKYLDLLTSRRLWFAAPHTMDDDWEGALGMPNVVDGDGDSSRSDRPPLLYMSCWHAQEGESIAMWTQYARWGLENREGVAISSTYRRFFESISQEWPGWGVLGGVVNYVDYENTYIAVGNIFDRYMNKRPSFAHEREIRFVVPGDGTQDIDGVHVSIHPSQLIVEVRTAPRAPAWFVELVDEVTQRFTSHVPVLRSAIDAPPPR